MLKTWLPLLGAAALFGAGPYESVGFVQFPSEEEIGAMSAVAIGRGDRVYVLHRGPKPLMEFTSGGTFVKSWGEGLFRVPHGLRIDRQGNIWTTDNALNVLRKFSPDGRLIATLGESKELQLRSPDDLVFATNGQIVVADAGSGRLLKLSAKGRLLAEWGQKGKGPGEFAAAHGLAIDSQDRIYVADRGNFRVQVFSLEGKLLALWKDFGNPFGLLVAGRHLLVSDGDAHKIIHLALNNGSVAASWGDPQTLQLPHLMAEDSGGRLYVAEVNGKSVQIFKHRTGRSE